MQVENIIHKPQLKFLDIFLAALSFYKLVPRIKQIFRWNDILVGMNTSRTEHTFKITPPPTILPVLEKLKTGYKLWHEYHELVPKTQKYTLGKRIDSLFIEALEATATAAFLSKTEKAPWIRMAIRKLDTMKILLLVLWESRSIDDKKYISLSTILNDGGKMLGGWYGQVIKQNSPAQAGEK